jgi:hypothetical protein
MKLLVACVTFFGSAFTCPAEAVSVETLETTSSLRPTWPHEVHGIE